MDYQYCDYRNQRVCLLICEIAIQVGKCKKTRNGCRPVRHNHISEEEREKRSQRMKQLRKEANHD